MSAVARVAVAALAVAPEDLVGPVRAPAAAEDLPAWEDSAVAAVAAVAVAVAAAVLVAVAVAAVAAAVVVAVAAEEGGKRS